MNKQEAKALLESANRDLESYANQRANLDRKEAGTLEVISGLYKLFPELSRPQANNAARTNGASRHPRGQDAVLRVLREADAWMSVNDVVVVLEAKGWLPRSDNPEEAIRTTVHRLWKSAQADRKKAGRFYLYRPTPEPVQVDLNFDSTKDLGTPAAKAEVPKPGPFSGGS